MVYNIRNNTISEICAKERLNALNEKKKQKRRYNKIQKAHPWTKRVIKLIQRFIRHNFNLQNTKIRKSKRQK